LHRPPPSLNPNAAASCSAANDIFFRWPVPCEVYKQSYSIEPPWGIIQAGARMFCARMGATCAKTQLIPNPSISRRSARKEACGIYVYSGQKICDMDRHIYLHRMERRTHRTPMADGRRRHIYSSNDPLKNRRSTSTVTFKELSGKSIRGDIHQRRQSCPQK